MAGGHGCEACLVPGAAGTRGYTVGKLCLWQWRKPKGTGSAIQRKTRLRSRSHLQTKNLTGQSKSWGTAQGQRVLGVYRSHRLRERKEVSMLTKQQSTPHRRLHRGGVTGPGT